MLWFLFKEMRGKKVYWRCLRDIFYLYLDFIIISTILTRTNYKKRIFCCFSFIYVFSLFKLFWENLSSFLTFFYTKPISLYLATTHSHVWKIRMTFLWRWNNETKNVDIDILSTIRVCRISYCCSNKKSYVSFRPI